MVDATQFVFQLLRSAAGFIAGVGCCGLFLAWGFFAGPGGSAHPGDTVFIVGSGLLSASAVGASVFLPALALILAAELARWRSVMYHVGAGGGLAFVLWTLSGPLETAPAADLALRPGTAVALAAGFLGGFVYWLVAGRLSGCWKLPQT